MSLGSEHRYLVDVSIYNEKKPEQLENFRIVVSKNDLEFLAKYNKQNLKDVNAATGRNFREFCEFHKAFHLEHHMYQWIENQGNPVCYIVVEDNRA